MITQASLVGVHGRMTYKPLLVFKLVAENDHELRILGRAGFGLSVLHQQEYTFFYDINNGECSYDPFKLSDQKTIGEAARWIRKNGMPEPGAFIDCEYLRGEKDEPMTFEDEFDYCPWKD